MADNAWKTMDTAPKSTTESGFGGDLVRGAYILGYCPDEGAVDPMSCICLVWWEPHMTSENGTKGRWEGEAGYEMRPTLWAPLPPLPSAGLTVEKEPS